MGNGSVGESSREARAKPSRGARPVVVVFAELYTGTQAAFNVGNTSEVVPWTAKGYLGERTYANRRGYRAFVKDKASSHSIGGVMLILSVLGEIVELRKYPEPAPHMKSTDLS